MKQIEQPAACALAEQPAEQEPVAWCDQYESHIDGLRHYSDGGSREMPLYTAPQPRKRLTDEEIRNALRFCFEWEGQVDEAMLMHIDEYRAIEDAVWSKT